MENQKSPQEEKKTSPSQNTGMAIVAYILFFVPLLTDSKDDPFVKFHVKQGLILTLSLFAAAFISWIPIIGWLIGIFWPLVGFVLWIIGIMNAVNGKKENLPLIGKFAEEWFKF